VKHALFPLLFSFASECALLKVQKKNQVALKLNGTHQLLAYVDDLNLLGDDSIRLNKNTNFNQC
jgi:hypothetical protein